MTHDWCLSVCHCSLLCRWTCVIRLVWFCRLWQLVYDESHGRLKCLTLKVSVSHTQTCCGQWLRCCSNWILVSNCCLSYTFWSCLELTSWHANLAVKSEMCSDYLMTCQPACSRYWVLWFIVLYLLQIDTAHWFRAVCCWQLPDNSSTGGVVGWLLDQCQSVA